MTISTDQVREIYAYHAFVDVLEKATPNQPICRADPNEEGPVYKLGTVNVLSDVAVFEQAKVFLDILIKTQTISTAQRVTTIYKLFQAIVKYQSQVMAAAVQNKITKLANDFFTKIYKHLEAWSKEARNLKEKLKPISHFQVTRIGEVPDSDSPIVTIEDQFAPISEEANTPAQQFVNVNNVFQSILNTERLQCPVNREITGLPADMAVFLNLQALSVTNQKKLTAIPKSIFELPLRSLHLEQNGITKLPEPKVLKEWRKRAHSGYFTGNPLDATEQKKLEELRNMTEGCDYRNFRLEYDNVATAR